MATESSAKVVIKGDAKHLVGEAKKAEAAIDQIGQRSKYLGQALRDANKELAGTAIRAAIVLRTFNAIGDAYDKLRTEKTGASSMVGGAEVKAQLAGQRLGLSGADASGLLAGAGTASLGDRAGFIERLAGDDRAGSFSGGDVKRAAALHRSGLYSESEVIEALRSGSLDKLEGQDRYGAMTSQGRDAYRTEAYERGTEIDVARGRAAAGNAARRVDANVARSDAAQSDLSRGYMEAFGQATQVAGGDRLIQYLKRVAESNERLESRDLRPRIGEEAQ